MSKVSVILCLPLMMSGLFQTSRTPVALALKTIPEVTFIFLFSRVVKDSGFCSCWGLDTANST